MLGDLHKQEDADTIDIYTYVAMYMNIKNYMHV